MKLSKTLALLGAISILAVSASAQRQGGMRMMGGGGAQPAWMLLARTDVQEDLKLTDDQKTKLDTMRDEMMASMRERFQRGGGGGNGGGERPSREEMQKQRAAMEKEVNDKLAAILTADQIKRIKEISIQMAGSSSVYREEIAKELAITETQKTKLDELQTTMNRANRSLMEKVRNQEIDPESFQASMKKNSEALNAEIDKVLTSAQKDKLKAMGGSPFTRKDETN